MPIVPEVEGTVAREGGGVAREGWERGADSAAEVHGNVTNRVDGQRGPQTLIVKVTLTDPLERKWPGQWPLGGPF